MTAKNIILFIFICLIELALSIVGSLIIGCSLTILWFNLSFLFLSIGLGFLYWVPKYLRSRYIKKLQNKYSEVEAKDESSKKIKRSYFLKMHALSTQAKIFIGCFFMAIVFALVPIVKWEISGFKIAYNILDVLRTAMQFFAVDGGLEDLILTNRVIGSVEFYSCYVSLLCVCAGILFAYNIVIIFAKEFCTYLNYWLLHPLSAIYVMNELNERSVTLAESILLKYKNSCSDKKSDMRWTPRFYFCNSKRNGDEESLELTSRVWQLGATVLKRDITEIKIKLGAKSNTFYFIANDEEDNINQAKQICDAYKKKNIKKNLRIYIYASRTESEMIIDDINEQFYKIYEEEKKEKTKEKEYPLTIRRIDEHYRFALDFFWEHGERFFECIKNIDNNEKLKIFRVGFVGFGEYAYELLKTLCALGQLPSCRLIIYIFDKDADIKHAKFQRELLDNRVNNTEAVQEISSKIEEASKAELENIKYHDTPFYEIHFVKCDVERNDAIDVCVDKKFTHMFFLLGDDKLNIDIATKLSTAYARKNYEFKFYAMVKSDETIAQLRRQKGTINEYYPQVTFFGANCERYTYENIAEDRIEEVAKQIHKNYCINRIFADIYRAVDECADDLKNDRYSLNIQAFKMQLYYMKDEILRKWRENPDINSAEINTIIQDKKYSALTKSLEEQKCGKGKSEQKSIQSVINAITGLKDKLREVWDVNVLNREFYKEEYFRRSSKARALFEKLLFDLGYLCVDKDNKNIIIRKNVVCEYVEDNEWVLKGKHQDQYLPKNIPFYLVLYRKSQRFKPGYDENYANYLRNSEYKNFEECRLESQNINSQWFELNNIFQKRWMVFRWGEGYQKSEEDKKYNKPRNRCNKTHAYIIPYVNVYIDDYKRYRHTVYVYLPKEQDRKRLGYKISVLD